MDRRRQYGRDPSPEPEEFNEPESNGPCSWLDDGPKISPSRTFHSQNSSKTMKDLEDNLTKEKLKSSRLQSEIDRLTSQVKTSRIGGSSSLNSVRQFIKEINFNDVKVKDKIGEGGFSTISKGEWMGIDVAVKIIFDPKVTKDLLEEFNNEIEKLFLVRHPNIIQLYGVCNPNQKLAIVTELASHGSLFDFLHKSNQREITNEFKFKITKQLINVMHYLHDTGLVHRDLKTQNILLDEHDNMKLCDFGLTKAVSDLNTGSGQFAGTPIYMAPELFNRVHYDEKVDVFAFGTILWELFARKIPYPGCDSNEIKNKINSGEKLPITRSIPAKIGEIINKCRSVDPKQRPTFKELSYMKLE